MATASDSVPDEIAAEVVEFVRARSHDPLSPSATTDTLSNQLADTALVREYERALSAGRRVTADNLALTLLLAATRFKTHPDFQRRWLFWAPFGQLDPLGGPQPETDPG